MDSKESQNSCSPSPLNLSARTSSIFIPLGFTSLDNLILVRNDPCNAKRRSWQYPFSIQDARQYLRAIGADTMHQSRTYMIYKREDHSLLGECTVTLSQADRRQVELQLLPVSTVAVVENLLREAVSYLFSGYELSKIYSLVPTHDLDWIQCMENAGFSKEALFIEAAEINGCWHDNIFFGLLKREYIASI